MMEDHSYCGDSFSPEDLLEGEPVIFPICPTDNSQYHLQNNDKIYSKLEERIPFRFQNFKVGSVITIKAQYSSVDARDEPVLQCRDCHGDVHASNGFIKIQDGMRNSYDVEHLLCNGHHITKILVKSKVMFNVHVLMMCLNSHQSHKDIDIIFSLDSSTSYPKWKFPSKCSAIPARDSGKRKATCQEPSDEDLSFLFQPTSACGVAEIERLVEKLNGTMEYKRFPFKS